VTTKEGIPPSPFLPLLLTCDSTRPMKARYSGPESLPKTTRETSAHSRAER
jgi:hypothetical protein